MIKNNYYDIAYEEYRYLQSNLNKGFYNQTIPAICQICEKLLKSLIVDFDLPIEERFLKSHRIDRIFDEVKRCVTVPSELDFRDMSWLSHFYFDCHYPGDNFIIATKQQEETAVDIMEKTLNWVNTVRQNGVNSKQ